MAYLKEHIAEAEISKRIIILNLAILFLPTFSKTVVKLSFSMSDYTIIIRLQHIGQTPNCFFPMDLSILLMYYKVTVLHLTHVLNILLKVRNLVSAGEPH